MWHWHQTMADLGLSYTDNAHRIRALDTVFATHDEHGPILTVRKEFLKETAPPSEGSAGDGSANELAADDAPATNVPPSASPPHSDKYCFEGGYRLPWDFSHGCPQLLDQSPEEHWEAYRKFRKTSCDYVKCKARYTEEGGGKKQECGSCRVVAYCSRACQVADWGTHKEECKVWSTERLKEKALGGLVGTS
jgi:hypothetical protein